MRVRMILLGMSVAVSSLAVFGEDIGSRPIPNQPASGVLSGTKFKASVATLKNLGFNKATLNGKVQDRAASYELNLASDSEFFPNQEIQIWLNAEPGKPLDGQTFVFRPYKFGTDEARKQSYGNRTGGALVPRGVTAVFMSVKKPGSNLPKTEMFMDQFAVRLEFGRSANGVLPGKVYVWLPDAKHSFVAGTFVATIQKN